MTPTTDAVVIGAGQAGLAVSRCLTDAGRDHVVIERGRRAERWRSERWDSLRLLTPAWMTRLPGWSYQGSDPGAFLTAGEVVRFLSDFARSFDAPVREETTVRSVTSLGEGYRVETDQGTWLARDVIVATGHCGHPTVPALASDLSPAIAQVTSDRYRNPDSLPDGGVLVVGGSSTGLQLSEELARAGRRVVLAVGGHTRMPRRYRGRDVFEWFEEMGILDDVIDDHPDPDAARRSPSMQLVGDASGRTLDLATCRASGVQVAGRLTRADGGRVSFAEGLSADVARSEARMSRTLDAIDAHVARTGVAAEPSSRPAPIPTPEPPRTLDLRREGIGTVLWATGFGRSYPWLHVPVTDARGELRHVRGVTPAAGLYAVGLRFQHRRSSNFIDGVGRDARFVVDHLVRRSACLQAA